MIKKNKITVESKKNEKPRMAQVVVPKALVESFAKRMSQGLLEARGQLNYWEVEATRYRRYLKNAEENIEKEKEKIAGFASEEIKIREKATAEAKELFDKLRAHAGVRSVSATQNGTIKVRTMPLWVDIRREAGARTYNRTFIGDFTIKMGPGGISITNEFFKNSNSLDHWAINCHNPCLGSYENEVNDAFRKKDYFTLFEIMYYFLHSTDDGSAFARSHDWRDKYRSLARFKRKNASFEIGDKVVVMAEESDGKGLLGQVGKIVYVPRDTNWIGIEFKNSCGGHSENGKGKNGFCWRVQALDIQKISEAQYEKASSYNVSENAIGRRVMEAIDKMPFGTQIEEITDVVTTLYNEEKLKLA